MSGLDYTLAELDLAGVPTGLVDDPLSTFLGDDGHVWTITGRSSIPLYDEVVRDDGVVSVRRSDWVRIAGLQVTGSIQRHLNELELASEEALAHLDLGERKEADDGL